ncbi:hypothetical protein NDA07_02510 [Microcoleus vaginatus DQ-U2]|uniref:hypothetical protein n=1 Tax=Microcoleus vaginatus TaxID=119532 RepID=UPI001681DD41|nr:hypothetical protein [Microcoleus sp. FACHB-DQ6]
MITDIFVGRASVLWCLLFFVFKKIDKFWYAAILSAAVVSSQERNYVQNLSREADSVFGEKDTFDLRVEKPIFKQKQQ